MSKCSQISDSVDAAKANVVAKRPGIGVATGTAAARLVGIAKPVANQAAPTLSLDASVIQTGTMDSSVLGSGSADDTTFLRGDLTWQPVSGGVLPPTISGGTF